MSIIATPTPPVREPVSPNVAQSRAALRFVQQYQLADDHLYRHVASLCPECGGERCKRCGKTGVIVKTEHVGQVVPA